MKLEKKYRIVLGVVILILIIFFGSFIKKDWSFYEYKYGLRKPLFWNMSEYHNAIYSALVPNREFENLNIHMTDLYFMENANALFFGIWFNKSQYPSRNLNANIAIDLEFDDGTVKRNYTTFPETSTFQEFRVIRFDDVNLKNIRQVYLELSPMRGKQKDTSKTERKLIYDANTSQLRKEVSF